MTKYALVIMAAGIGRRYGGLKQIEPVGPNGENTIEYSVFDALQAGFSKVVFVINKEIEETFRNTVGNIIEKQCETVYVFQDLNDMPAGYQPPSNRIKPWGTAHAVLSCKHVIDSPFAVINADDYYGPSSYKILLAYLKGVPEAANQYCMMGYAIENTLTEHGPISRGLCTLDGDDYLVDIRERTHIERTNNLVKYSNDGGNTWIEIANSCIVSMNFWGFKVNIFHYLEKGFYHFLENPKINLEEAEYFLPAVIQEQISVKNISVKVLTTHEKWFGVTYQKDKLKAQQEINDLIRREVYPSPLWRL